MIGCASPHRIETIPVLFNEIYRVYTAECKATRIESGSCCIVGIYNELDVDVAACKITRAHCGCYGDHLPLPRSMDLMLLFTGSAVRGDQSSLALLAQLVFSLLVIT